MPEVHNPPNMPRFHRPLAVLALGLLAAASAVAEPGEQPLARLQQPAAGSTLVAGSWAWLEWQPTASMASLAGIAEWEAFLSLDGGRSYSIRATPHLSITRRRVSFRVPEVGADDVRLLLRFGDERTEHALVVPGRWQIAGGATAVEAPVAPAFHLGEAARPGEAGTLAWSEEVAPGRWRERQVVSTESGWLPNLRAGRLHLAPLAPPRSSRDSAPAPPALLRQASVARLTAPPPLRSTPSDGRSLRLLQSRQNE